MLTFTYPWLLWGLAGLALPILAHMVHRHTTRRISFPSLRFIRVSRIPRKGKDRPTDLLLLLLRLLLLAAALLCLAGPRWMPTEGVTPTSGEETIILVDNSASMQGWGVPEEIRTVLPNLLKDIKGQVGAVTFTEGVPPGAEGLKFLQDLDPSKTVLSRGSPEQAITRAVSLFSAEARKRDLIIISDFQASDWQLVTARLGSLGISIRLVPVGKIREGNLSVQGVRTSPAAENKVRVWAQVANHSGTRQKLDVTLAAGEQEWKQTVDIPGDQTGQVQFLLPREEYFQGRVYIGEDAFAGDNVFHFWLMPPPVSRVEFVMTPNDDPLGKEESFFLRTAVVSSTRNEWRKYLVTHHSFNKEGTPKVDAVFIPGLGSHVTGKVLGRIHAHVQAGGRVVATPGESPAEMLSMLRKQGFLEADYRGTSGNATGLQDPARISGLDPGNPLADVFSGEAGKDLYLSRIHQHVSLRPRGDFRTLMKLEDDSPLLVESRSGKGSLFLFTTRFHATWSDLPLRNCFLPLVRELLTGFGDQQESEWPRLVVGESLSNEGESLVGEKPGLVEWQGQLVAINVPREESVSEVLPTKTIKESLGTLGPVSAKAFAAGLIEEEEAGNPLGHWLILLVAACFLVETLWVRPRLVAREEYTG